MGFYVNEDFTCTAVPSQIEYCGIYDTSNTCKLCFNNYVLVSNKKKCVLSTSIEDYIDKNCLNSFISPEPICNLCQQGYYFQVPTEKLLIKSTDTQIANRVLESNGNEPLAKVGLVIDELNDQIANPCVACPNINEGCTMCYPKNPSFCLLCQEGYTHDSDGTCTLTEPLPPPPPDNGVGVLQIGWVLLVALLQIIGSFE